MDFNKNDIKAGFGAYLIQYGKINSNDISSAENDLNIFKYADDFKNYLDEKFNGNKFGIQSKSIPEILKFISDGKLADSEEITAYDNAINDGSRIENQITDENIEIFTNVFNELLKEDIFKNAIDSDGDGEINDEEIADFLDSIKDYDENGEDISVEDLLTAAQQINDGTFSVPVDENGITENEIAEIKNDLTDKKTTATVSRSSNYRGVSKLPRRNGVNQTKKTPADMNTNELETELKKANDNLSAKQKALSSIYDGSDPRIQALEEDVKKAEQEYKNQLKSADENLANQVDELQQKIDLKQQEINTKDNEISSKETEISNKETAYNNAVSTRENLESTLRELQSSDSEDENLSSKISEVKIKIEEAKQAEIRAKEAVETAKNELAQLQEERKELQEGENGLNQLNEQMSQLKSKSAEEYPEVIQAQADWDKAKETLISQKASAIQQAKNEITNAQNYVNKVQTELNNYNNSKTKSKYTNQYNQNAGNRLANAAQRVRGTVGHCMGGVDDTFQAVYGMRTGCGSAYLAADVLASDKGLGAYFTEVKVEREDLANLPKGAVVVWNNNRHGGGSNVSAAGKKHGHISIALGNGKESSDHIQRQIVNRDATFRVFYPKA